MGGKTITFNPDGTTTIEDTRSLDQAIAEAVDRAKTRYADQIAAGMDWQGSPLQIDQTAVQNISAVMLQVVAQVPLPEGFAWRMGDNTYMPMDAAGVAAMATAASAQVQALRVELWAAVDAARAAETIEAADAVLAPAVVVYPEPVPIEEPVPAPDPVPVE